MSALRTSDVTRLESIAWRAFIELDLGFGDLYGYETFDKVLAFVNEQQYKSATLTCISLVAEEGCYSLDQFNEWMSKARTNFQRIERIAAHSIVRQLRAMVGTVPRHGDLKLSDWLFLGRFRRHLGELPLTPMQLALPKMKDRVVDLWGREDGTAVMVCDESTQALAFGPNDEHDSHAREAFRRLAKEVVPMAP